MRKIASLLTMLMLLSALAFSQTRTVTGQIKDDKGDAVAFASVIEAGNPNNGTKADGNGYFTIKIKDGAKLTITAQGFKPVTITPTSGVQVINMVTDVTVEKEVVVTTAFGIKKSARTTPFSSQVINSEALNIVPSSNLNASLAGKVAGVQFRGQSPMKLDNQGFLRIRGGLSLGDVGAIYVIDGTIVNSFDINPEDIQDLNILKGANATALFGEAAKNGAVVITTRKKGEKGTAGIEFSQGITIDNVYLLPQYQNLYGGGQNREFSKFEWKSYMPMEWKTLDGKYFPDYTDDSSWGPRMAGQEYIPWYAWYPASPYSGQTAKWLPEPNNAKEFWNTGVTSTTNVSFAKSGQGFSTRISYTNAYIRGMIPNSSSERHTVFATGQLDLNEHFSAGVNVTFVNTKILGEFDDGYANQSSGAFSQWFHRDLDMNRMKELKDLKSPLGTFASWNLYKNPDAYDPSNPGTVFKGNYWYNFFTYFENVDNRRSTDRVYGDIFLKYTINKNFSVKGTVRKNQIYSVSEDINRSNIQESALQTGLFASYGTALTRADAMNYELLASYSNKFLGKLDVSASVGGNWNRTKSQSASMSTRNGLIVPELYAITNSKDPINYANGRSKSEVRSVFATGDFEWNRFASITWAVRSDWYSTLTRGENRLISPQVGAGFVFSEFTKESLPWLSFGKVYGSWGKKPTSIGAYANNFSYTVGANQWMGNILMTTPNTLVDPNLQGSLVTTYEFGFDLRFLKNRLGINATYYIEDNDGEPLAVNISGVAGFTSKLINAAEIKRQGFEIILNAKPFSNVKNFSWDITKTFGYIVKNPIVKLSEGQTQVLYARGTSFSGFTAPGVFFELDKDWGQLIGMGIMRNDQGLPMIKTNGTYLNDPLKHWGSVVPKLTGGLVNAITYKDFNLNFSLDYQFGGKFFSLSEMWGNYSGLLAPTAAINDKGYNVRDDVADGGGVHVVGVAAADGKTPVDVYVDAQTFFHSLFSNNVVESYVHSLSFVKLRQVALGYNIPVQKMKIGKVIKGATVSVISSNTWLLYRETKNFDPSEIQGVQGENGQYPGTRSIGASLKLRF